jgi:hypothetical protein
MEPRDLRNNVLGWQVALILPYTPRVMVPNSKSDHIKEGVSPLNFYSFSKTSTSFLSVTIPLNFISCNMSKPVFCHYMVCLCLLNVFRLP